MIVDVHAHAVPRPLLDAVEKDPERFGIHFEREGENVWPVLRGRRIGPTTPQWFDVEHRLADMDATGIHTQVLSPLPPFLFYWADPGQSAEIAAVMNDGIAAMIAESPERFWGVGQLPLQSTELSLAELDHVAALGLSGLMMGANVAGKELDDESLEPVWAKIDDLGLTIFIHSLNPGLLARMEPYHLTNIIGNPLDTTIAVSRLILSGVMQRHPGIRFYFAHAGGFMPYLYGRIDHAHGARDDTSSVIDALPSTFLKSCWFDTITHAEPPLRYLIDSMGDTHVVVGTDYPADMGDTRIAGVLADLGLSAETRGRIEHENAAALFGRANGRGT